jgi:BON domain
MRLSQIHHLVRGLLVNQIAEANMKRRSQNYSSEGATEENFNNEGKYSLTGESAFSRNMSLSFDSGEEFFMNNFDDGLNKRLVDFSGSEAVFIRPDIKIKEDAIEAISLSDEVTSAINVTVEEGILTLEGEAEDRKEKNSAERLVGLIPGVVNVVNLLRVRSKGGRVRAHI